MTKILNVYLLKDVFVDYFKGSLGGMRKFAALYGDICDWDCTLNK
jgi:hypothetical protein